MIVAAISAIANFGWLPYSPWWALMVIGLDILIIWALASYLRQPEPLTPGVPAVPKETPASMSRSA